MSSHRQIFKSTALIGGTQVFNLGFNILRTKVLAMLLGPAGIGLAGLYMSAVGVIGAVAGLGINASGVRQIAEAASSQDETKIARTIITLRRVALISGLLGMVLVLALAPFLSRTTFGDNEHILGIALMSLTLLFGGISAGQGALLQGLRRLRDLAASQIIGAGFGAVVSIALVWWLREDGIVPYLVAISAFGMLLTWWYARRVPVQRLAVSLKETLTNSRNLLGMGLAFTASALITSLVAYLTRMLVQRELGVNAVGLYMATWTLSSYYVGFVLTAMGTDFVPRLTSVANDHPTLNRLVNEQTEMGILIALPGVLATLALAPWVLHTFYSEAFVQGAGIVRWQILGVFLRVVSWPLGFVLIAKGKGLLFTLSEVIAYSVYVVLFFGAVRVWKTDGIGIAFALLYVFYTAMMAVMIWRLTGFFWAVHVVKILILSLLVVGLTFTGVKFLPPGWGIIFGLTATLTTGFACVSVMQRLLRVNARQWLLRKLNRE